MRNEFTFSFSCSCIIVSKYMRIDTHSHIPLSLCTKRIEVEWSYEDLWNWEVNIWIQEHLAQPQWLNLNMNRNNLVCSSSLVKSESTSTYLCFILTTYQSPKKALIIFLFLLVGCELLASDPIWQYCIIVTSETRCNPESRARGCTELSTNQGCLLTCGN